MTNSVQYTGIALLFGRLTNERTVTGDLVIYPYFLLQSGSINYVYVAEENKLVGAVH